MSKTVENTLLVRRSIRRYEYDPVKAEDMEFIYAAIRNTPTSYNGQQFSVIDITDRDIKEKLYEITGQKQIKTCSHFMVFVADYHKMSVAWAAKGVAPSSFPRTVDGYTVGVIDASLALMSAIVAAESRGLGTCPIGYVRTADPEAVSRLLKLPEGVSFTALKKAVAAFIQENESIEDDDLEEELYGYDKIGEDGDIDFSLGTMTAELS